MTPSIINLDPATTAVATTAPVANSLDQPTPPFSEKEAIEIVQEWELDNVGVDPSEQMSQQEMIKELLQIDPYRSAEYGQPPSGISADRFAEIVRTYAPNAPHRKKASAIGGAATNAASVASKRDERGCQTGVDVSAPAELAKRIASGQVWYDPHFEHWVIRRCQKCGEFGQDVCCDETTRTVSVCNHKSAILNTYGKQAAGLIDIRRPEPPKPIQEMWKEAGWWRSFRGVDELQGDGTIDWIIQNVVPAGVTVVTANAKDGKSFLVLSFVKAIITGQPWLGRVGFEVPEAMPVLWLAAESGDSSLKIRCSKFRITNDKSRFICRTLTQGMLDLDDPELKELVRAMKPYIVLETLIRFGGGEDENDSKEASQLASLIFQLIAWGAQGVLAIHHARKDLKRGDVDLEKAVRGSGDYAAMADAIWVLVRDERLYQKGKGPNEISLSGWGRDFSPYPMRLALTRRAPKDLPPSIITFAPGIVSVIDETKDLGWVNEQAVQAAAEAASQTMADTLERMVQADPAITVAQLASHTGQTRWAVSCILTERGWSKPSGRAKKGKVHRWVKAASSTEIRLN